MEKTSPVQNRFSLAFLLVLGVGAEKIVFQACSNSDGPNTPLVFPGKERGWTTVLVFHTVIFFFWQPVHSANGKHMALSEPSDCEIRGGFGS